MDFLIVFGVVITNNNISLRAHGVTCVRCLTKTALCYAVYLG